MPFTPAETLLELPRLLGWVEGAQPAWSQPTHDGLHMSFGEIALPGDYALRIPDAAWPWLIGLALALVVSRVVRTAAMQLVTRLFVPAMAVVLGRVLVLLWAVVRWFWDLHVCAALHLSTPHRRMFPALGERTEASYTGERQ